MVRGARITPWAREYLDGLSAELAAAADPARALAMRAYMRDRFEFFGVPAPVRRSLQRQVAEAVGQPEPGDVRAFPRPAWRREERELQYAGADLLRRHEQMLNGQDLAQLRDLVTTKPWWDTVDELAVVVGAIVRRDPARRSVMDEWLVDDDIWLVRVAILHQERWRQDADLEWLFAACRRRAEHRDFFVRKAIGWALRSAAKVAPDPVAAFVDEMGAGLSGVSRREAEAGIARGRAPRS